eukprot:CAMPEP_0172649102 /NCGR_PEP_ID=MMETSP1068-20121228/241616_1 /TAXON_ID=35684 /ORGANISM="Pseudopedinella elastica, Strain CCMP716" /LENGTH=30 /DNA_ID= /DNA_START= /DNA_END= /DNA_ORIENTATION=
MSAASASSTGTHALKELPYDALDFRGKPGL